MSQTGYRLRQLRRQAGMSVRVFATAVASHTGYEVSHSSVAQYESGRTVPAEYLAAVATTFEVNAAWLLGTERGAVGADPGVAQRAFEEITDVVDRYRPAPSAAEADLRLFMDLSHVLFCIGSNGYLVRFNDSWQTVLGHDRETLMNTPVLELIHPEDRERAEECHARSLQGGSVDGERFRFRHSDGTYRWLSCNCRGIAGRIYSVLEDVTEWVREEEALKQEAETFRRIVAHCPHGVLLHQNGTILLCNPAAGRILECSDLEQLEGSSVWNFFPAEHRDLLDDGQVERRSKEGSPFRTLSVVGTNGGRAPVHVAAVPLSLGGAQAVQVVIHPHAWVAAGDPGHRT